jgi:NADH:ubiquinone reductase (H+-translocating)
MCGRIGPVSRRRGAREGDKGDEMAETRAERDSQRPQVVIIGAGFGGLAAARELANTPLDVLIIDRNNYHGFWPLLYQVATAGLQAQSITEPVRALMRRWRNVRFFLATVERIDRERRVVITDRREVPYDHLIVAAGSATNFFGLESIERHGFELKDLPDAIRLRNHLLTRFEQASGERDPERVRQLLTFVVVGGGPTGVELAGAIAELINHVLRKDYPTLDLSLARVILLEMMDRVLPPFPQALSRKAQQRLTAMGVEVRLKTEVTDYNDGTLQIKDGEPLPAETVIWTAGIKASPLGESLGVELQRGGRVPVTPALHLPDDSRVWIAGDMAHAEGPDRKPYGQLAAVAMQQGRHAARNLLRSLRGQPLQPFRYRDKGILATIGRHAAVARVWNINWSGPIAWYLWLGVHLWQLAGFQNRLLVFINWIYRYLTYDRAERAVIAATRESREEYAQHAAALVDDAEVIEPSEAEAEAESVEHGA